MIVVSGHQDATMDIAGWLRARPRTIRAAFRETMSMTVPPNLVEDLKDLDVGSIGHRRSSRSHRALRDAAESTAPAPISRQPETAPPASERYFLTSWRSG
jgi:hypothetical protein